MVTDKPPSLGGLRARVLDGAALTAKRTAALSVLAARTLAPHPDGPLLIVGAGTQARSHLEAFREGLGVSEVLLSSRTLERALSLAEHAPCGSGTSARLALLDNSGRLARGDTLSHESIIGTEFGGRVVGETQVGEFDAVITEVEGSAYLTGYHQFVLHRDDPLGTGFLLR